MTCHDMATETEPIEIDCPVCEQEGCRHCDEKGHFEIMGCPNKYCEDVFSMVELIGLFDDGIPPVQGGVLDQSAPFIQSRQFFKSQLAIMGAD